MSTALFAISHNRVVLGSFLLKPVCQISGMMKRSEEQELQFRKALVKFKKRKFRGRREIRCKAPQKHAS
jgi:hypothetical protein